MKDIKSKFIFLMSVYAIIMIMYSVCRLIFILTNALELKISDAHIFFNVFLYGFRYDISAVMYSNLLFTIIFLFVGNKLHKTPWKQVLNYLFIVINAFFLLLNSVDVVYFPFIQKRMQSDALLFATGEKGSEALGMLPHFALQYFWLWIIWVIMIWGLVRIYKLTDKRYELTKSSDSSFLSKSIFLLIMVGINLIGVRGGLQLRPINIINASEKVGVENAPAVLNSTFSLIRTWQKKSLSYPTWFQETDLNNCENGIHISDFGDQDSIMNMNVMIIMVESLSKSYISGFGGSSQTPFLDSLMQKSLVFSNAFANARESVQGIPAVLSSIPALMDEPFIFSRYSGNHVNSLASLLKSRGYNSTFFHGASTGTMGFKGFTKSIGFDDYVGKENYPEPIADFDGSWGIWDHKFLPYMGMELSKKWTPFLAAVLTLNSHHPFKVPDEFETRFKMKGHPILSSIRYVDFSLSLFFESIKTQPWYTNTLFVITADHTGPNNSMVKTPIDDYSIPIIFFTPKGYIQPGMNIDVANQIDIMPTLLDIMHFRLPYFSLGRNLLGEECPKFSVNYKMGIYQYLDSEYFMQFDGQKMLSFYDIKNDKKLKNNLLKNNYDLQTVKPLQDQLQKKIQVFNSRMIDDKMIIKKNDNER